MFEFVRVTTRKKKDKLQKRRTSAQKRLMRKKNYLPPKTNTKSNSLIQQNPVGLKANSAIPLLSLTAHAIFSTTCL
jgi:hypothetical protein